MRSILRRTLKAAGLLLVVFHAWLLGRDAWAGALADPGLLARWAVAGGLAWGLIALHGRGVSLLRSRQAVSIWVLAALLHGPALAGPLEVAEAPVTPIVAASLAPAAAVTLAGLLVLLALGVLRRRVIAVARVGFCTSHARLGALAPGAPLPFAQRPPPGTRRV